MGNWEWEFRLAMIKIYCIHVKKLSNNKLRRLLLINVQKMDFLILVWENWSPTLGIGHEVHSFNVIQFLLT